MKIKLFLFLSCFFSCHFVLADKLADLSLAEQQSLCLTESRTLINKKNQEAYQSLIEESLVYRALSMKTAQQLLIKVNNKNAGLIQQKTF